MGFYSRVIFPRLCDLLLNGPFVARHRQELLADVYGDTLEIGFGTGLNLPFYPNGVRKLTTIDPNVGMNSRARKRIERSTIEVDQRVLGGERLPFDNDRFDCVVSTFTLCSVAEVGQVLAEVYRVLKPGGRYFFLEHGLSPEPAVQKWQRRLNWLQARLADGCRLDRDIRGIVAAQPFLSLRTDEFYLENVPKTHGYMYRGKGAK